MVALLLTGRFALALVFGVANIANPTHRSGYRIEIANVAASSPFGLEKDHSFGLYTSHIYPCMVVLLRNVAGLITPLLKRGI